MSTNFRTVLERWRDLADADLLCPENPAETDWGAVVAAIAATRAALAQPEGEAMPYDLIRKLLHPAYEPGDGSADDAQQVSLAWWHPIFGSDSLRIVVDNARDLLARLGRRTALPVPEVCELTTLFTVGASCGGGARLSQDQCARAATLLAQLSAAPPEPEPGEAPAAWLYKGEPDFDGTTWRENWRVTTDEKLAHFKARPDCPVPLFRRPATLLQQQAAPAPAVVPVAVSERPWKRPGWLDQEGRCWFLSSRFSTWSLDSPAVALTRGIGRCLSLPAHAIPLPQAGEVEA